MKNLKFILSVMLIACMLFSFGAVAFAEDADVATVVFEANEPWTIVLSFKYKSFTS